MNDLTDFIMANTVLYQLFIALVGVLLITLLVRVMRKSLHRYVKDHSNWYKTRKAVNIFGVVLAAVFLAILYSDMLGGITVILGVASAGIAFSLREVIASIAGWLTVLVGGMFKTGDRVQLGGVTGDVIDLGVLRTTIMETGEWVNADLYSGRIVKIANSFVFTQPVYNYSTDFPFLWDEITLPVKFGSDYEFTRELIRQVADDNLVDNSEQTKAHWNSMVRKFLIEDATTDPMITLSVNDNWVEFTLRYIVEYKKRRGTQDILFTNILNEIEKNSDKVQLASATFELVNAPPVDVNVKKGAESGSWR
ncbi:mechanosensitive ion channel family protein [Salipaludibacillus sp. CUR1]|uniref:mechanosensitive ion channel family protein n=1 Tax=Salipaludibacillus sp. CUR1 TaxID=2820003 RepID=UPI001E59B02A|nr:mechanosensitive ion channel domain-containing protein [Salipaludibacillus sp. CUR1]MCE7792965.1 mechanosensitive ion channel family protein [Salipaludibacillus sp. CUR1]